MQFSNVTNPKALEEGDLVRIVSPSWPGAGLFPHRLERGRAALHNFGLRTDLAPNSLKVSDHTAGSAAERASDLNDAFRDENVRGIFCAIGGDHSNQLLPYLDWDAIKDNPKPFVGFSDVTVIQLAILTMVSVGSFYGPTVLTGLAEYPKILPYTYTSLRNALFSSSLTGAMPISEAWTDEYLEWSDKSDLIRARQLQTNLGPRVLREGVALGPLLGGCLPSVMHLKGTHYWPNFENAILFLETPEGGYDVADVDAHLTDLKLCGVFDKIGAMIIGRPYGFDSLAKSKLDRLVLENTRDWSFPIICDLDFGHTDPFFTLPIGATVRVRTEPFEIFF